MKRLSLLILVLLLAAFALPQAARAAFPGVNGKIAFVTGVDSVTGGDIWTMNVDGSARTQLTSGPGDDRLPSWSPDGTKILFTRYVEWDPQCGCWRQPHVYVMNADGSNLEQIIPNAADPDWSPDGTRIVYIRGGVSTADPDGTNEQTLSIDTAPYHYEGYGKPAWTPDGTEIAILAADCTVHCVGHHLFTVRPDGSDFDVVWASSWGARHDWSPDGRYLVVPDDFGPTAEGLGRINRDGSGHFHLADFGLDAAWAPDGTKIVYDFPGDGSPERLGELFTINPDGTGETNITNTPSVREFSPDWQPIPINGYPRPKGATPVHASLVPAYTPCASPNRQHGPPLAFGSCNPPAQTSDELTVGTADSNGKQTRSVSLIKLKTIPGVPPNPPDDADVKLEASVTDVYNQGALTDYAGELRVQTSLRITDKLNTPHPGGPGAGTVTDFSFGFTIPCASTPDPDEGGACTLNTTADALFPGAIAEGRRAIWQLGAVEVYDGGADDDGDTAADNTLFMKQGVFIP